MSSKKEKTTNLSVGENTTKIDDSQFKLQIVEGEGVQIYIPNDFVTVNSEVKGEGVIFRARTEKGSQSAPFLVTIAKTETSLNEQTVLTASVSNLKMNPDNFQQEKDYLILKEGKKVRVVERVENVDGKEFKRLSVFYILNSNMYMVSGFMLEDKWEESKDKVTATLLSFKSQ